LFLKIPRKEFFNRIAEKQPVETIGIRVPF